MSLFCEEKAGELVADLRHRVSPSNISPKYLSHYYCDFIELYAFFYKEAVTRSEILDLFDDYNFGFDTGWIQDDFEDDAGLIEIIDDGRVAEENDKKESDITCLFKCLEDRMNNSSCKYAFIVDTNSIELKDNLTFEQKIYLVLLFDSNLSVFREFKADLTSEFEQITYKVLSKMFSSNMVIKQFGKNSNYTGKAKDKINDLARDMKISTNQNEIDKISDKNTQDRGIDIILWQPYKDQIANNMIIYLVQCACGKDWMKKASEVFRYLAYFQFNGIQPLGILAISYGLSLFGSFEQGDDIATTRGLVLDRFRLLEFVNEPDFLEGANLVSIKLVDYLLGKDIELN